MGRGRWRKNPDDSFRIYVGLHYCECGHHLDVHGPNGICTVRGCKRCRGFKMADPSEK